MTTIVTGGLGFIGSHTVRALADGARTAGVKRICWASNGANSDKCSLMQVPGRD